MLAAVAVGGGWASRRLWRAAVRRLAPARPAGWPGLLVARGGREKAGRPDYAYCAGPIGRKMLDTTGIVLAGAAGPRRCS